MTRRARRWSAVGVPVPAGARGRDCPAGIYLLSASLTQGGLPTVWATSGHGAGEITCDGGTVSLAMGFYRNDPALNAGPATVRPETTRAVRIPR